jgi:hypothetical protein
MFKAARNQFTLSQTTLKPAIASYRATPIMRILQEACGDRRSDDPSAL